MRMRNRVAVMHGVNLDMLERRPPELYGDLSLPKLERLISQWAHELGLEAPGEPRIGCPVSEAELAGALEELAAP